LKNLYSRHKSGLGGKKLAPRKNTLRMRTDLQLSNGRASGLVDVLAGFSTRAWCGGDVKISLAEVELLTIPDTSDRLLHRQAQEIGLRLVETRRSLSPNRNRLSAGK